MIKASKVDVSKVTDAQIGMCEKIFELVGGKAKAFYKVQSESDSLVEYSVRWSAKHGFTCTCEAGQWGFANCHDSICKHVRWSVAAAKEERQAMRELEAAGKAA